MRGFRNRSRRKKYRRPDPHPDVSVPKNTRLYEELEANINELREQFGHSTDLMIRFAEMGKEPQIDVAVVYMDGLVNEQAVSQFVMHTLLIDSADLQSTIARETVFDWIKEHVLTIGSLTVVDDFQKLILSLLSGNTILLIDGWNQAIVNNTMGAETRGVTEPESQVVVRGPKDSFNESIRTNTSLIRRRIKSPNLWLETMQIGEVTQTDVGIMYIKGIANDKIVEEVRRRLKRIKIDGILESGYIEELIGDGEYTPFPTIFNTERPDSVAAQLLEGRIAIIVDGTPFVLVVPSTFIQFFQAAEDYYQHFDIATFVRFLRLTTFFIALFAPSVYIALTTFHPDLIPFPLLLSLAAQREGIPLPAFAEGIMMEMTFELLREAGIRIPRPVGPAISIVGAIVLGEAAVQAGLVSPSMAIVVSLTAVGNFAIPSYNVQNAARLLRFLFMIMAASFGFFGLILGLILMLAHMSRLRSFGVPYLAPFSPFILQDQKDALFRFPMWALSTRPRLVSNENTIRMRADQRPDPQGRHHRGENTDES